MTSSRQRRPGGFTLLELLVVLTLTALLVGIAAVRLGRSYRDAQFEDTVGRIPFADRLVRSHARQFAESGELVIDLDENRVFARSTDVGSEPRRQTVLPGSTRIDCVALAGRRVYRGTVAIPVTPDGQTPSYAVRLKLGDRRTRWLLMAGITGQATEYENATDVKEILQLLAP